MSSRSIRKSAAAAAAAAAGDSGSYGTAGGNSQLDPSGLDHEGAHLVGGGRNRRWRDRLPSCPKPSRPSCSDVIHLITCGYLVDQIKKLNAKGGTPFSRHKVGGGYSQHYKATAIWTNIIAFLSMTIYTAIDLSKHHTEEDTWWRGLDDRIHVLGAVLVLAAGTALAGAAVAGIFKAVKKNPQRPTDTVELVNSDPTQPLVEGAEKSVARCHPKRTCLPTSAFKAFTWTSSVLAMSQIIAFVLIAGAFKAVAESPVSHYGGSAVVGAAVGAAAGLFAVAAHKAVASCCCASKEEDAGAEKRLTGANQDFTV